MAIGDITGTIASLEFDTSLGYIPYIIHLSGDVYAIVYSGPGYDGWLKTVGIQSDGTITGTIASFEFDPTVGYEPCIIHISGDVYAIVYGGPPWGTDGWLKTVRIQSDGTITGTIASFEFDPIYGFSPEIIHISGDVYAIAYHGPDDDGWLKTVGIQSDGTITGTIASFEFDPVKTEYPDIIHVSGDVYAIAYWGPDGDGWLKTVGIQSDGTITGTIASFEFDQVNGYYPDIIHVSGDVYAIAYHGPDGDGWLKTVGIQSDGTITGTIASFEFDQVNGYYPDIIHVSGDVYAIAYHGPDGDGWLKTVGIQSDGTITGTIASFEFSPDDVGFPNILHVSGDVHPIVYTGPGTIGWLKTVGIVSASAAARHRFTGGIPHRALH